MRGKSWLLVLLIVGAMIGTGYWQYHRWGRQVIYPDNSTQTKYPGVGKQVGYLDAQIYVTPKGEGPAHYASEDEVDKYTNGQYDVVRFPGQEVWSYAVGRVVGWEEIVGTQDKYLLLDEGVGKTEKYRISFEPSMLFYDNGKAGGTLLGIEETSSRRSGGFNEMQSYVTPKVSELGSEAVEKIIKAGDSVIVVPVFAPPKYVNTDEQGVATASWLIVRRVEGVL